MCQNIKLKKDVIVCHNINYLIYANTYWKSCDIMDH